MDFSLGVSLSVNPRTLFLASRNCNSSSVDGTSSEGLCNFKFSLSLEVILDSRIPVMS